MSAFCVHSQGSQPLSGNGTMQISAYYATALFMQDTTQTTKPRINRQSAAQARSHTLSLTLEDSV